VRVRVFARQAPGDRSQLDFGPLGGYALPQPRDDPEGPLLAVVERRARERDRRPQLGDRGWMRETRRHHAHDGMGAAIELQRRADDVGARVESPAPQCIAQDDDVVSSGLPIFARERAAHRRGCAEHRKQARRELPADQRFRPSRARDGIRPIPVGFDRVEDLGALLPDAEIVAGALRVLPALSVPGGDPHEPLRVPVGKRRQEDAVYDGEDRHRRADAERHRQDGGGDEPRAAATGANQGSQGHARKLA
jgi:hypothetical protein